MKKIGWGIAAGVVAFGLTLAGVWAQQELASTLNTREKIEVQADPITSFDPREPQKTIFGKLTFRGGLVLKSTNRHFGGLSGLRVAPDGKRFLALSDRGDWMRGEIVYRGNVPVGIQNAEMAPMLGDDGKLLKDRGWFDTEALALDGDTAYVGIERVQQIVQFKTGADALNARGSAISEPGAIKLWPNNKSLECLEVMPPDNPGAGGLIAISERALDRQGNLESFVLGKSITPFSLKRTGDFDVSDCAAGPGGRLIVLERRFSWQQGVAIRLRSVPLESIKSGALVDGDELMFVDLHYEVDNMEGVTVHRDDEGKTVLTLISDDNFSPIQRTLLLQFTLNE